MNEQQVVLGGVVTVASIILNAILSIMSRGKKGGGWGGGPGLLLLSMSAFCYSLYFGYQLFGWLGAVGAFVVQVVGMFIAVMLLEGRITERP